MTDLDQTLPDKKKKTFKLRKRIEDAQNFNKNRDSKKTMILQNENKPLIGKFPPRNVSYQPTLVKTESDENDTKSDKNKKKPVLESRPTFVSSEVTGPQLKINKRYLSFLVKTGMVATEAIDVNNNGSTAIYYEWNRVEKNFLIGSSLKDNEERFYCHHKKNVIKPGETISFKFSFLSKVTGIFDEEWILNCEPHLIEPLPKIKFSGQAIVEDLNVKWQFPSSFCLLNPLEKSYIAKNIAEIVKDIVDNVRTPTPPLPDLENPEVCEREYEDKNYKDRLWYSSVVVSFLRNMEKELYNELTLNIEEQYWDMNVDYIRKLIAEVKEEEIKGFLERKFTDIYHLSRFRPYHKSPLYYHVRSLVVNVCRNIPDFSAASRKECDMWEYTFKEPPAVDLTEDELKKKKEEEAKIKADWLKKSKKKKFTEEDEKKLIEDYRLKFSQKCHEFFLDQFRGFEDNEDYIAVFKELDHNKRPDFSYFESLGKKKCLRDCDLDGRRVLMRIHLKLGETKEAIAKKEEHENNIIHAEELRRLELERLERERLEEEKRKKRGRGIVKKKNKKEEEEAARLAEERKKLEEEKKKEVPFLDPDNLEDILETLKLCQEKLAKLIIILISYDKPRGKYSQIHSVKFFEEFLQNKLEQSNILFSETTVIPDFLEKIDQEEYPENSILILENAFFQPEEVGFRIDSSDKMVKLAFEEKLGFIKAISEYGQLYVIEDKPNLFKQWTSLTALKPESTVLGVNSGKDISVVSYSMIVEKQPVVLFIGGDITPFKLLLIDRLLNLVDEIWLVGKIGIYFKMFNEKLDKFSRFELDDYKKKIIEKIYKNIMSMNILKSMPKSPQPNLRIAEIQLPCDFILSDLANNENEELEIPPEGTPEFIDFVKSREIYHSFLTEQEVKDFDSKEGELLLKEEEEKMLKQKQKELKERNYDEEFEEKNDEDLKSDRKSAIPVKEDVSSHFPAKEGGPAIENSPKKEENMHEKASVDLQKEGIYLMDFGDLTQRKLIRAIKNSRKLIWIDSLCPNESDAFNSTNEVISKFLYRYQEEKKNVIQKEMVDAAHDFEEDKIVFTIGKELDQKINTFDLVDPSEIKPTSQKDENEENKSNFYENEENKSQASALGNPTEIKRNNMGLIADFYAKDSDFACKLLSGRYPYGLTLLEEWEIKEGSEDEENFSFLDDI